jgi:hypothetical protein
MNEGPNDTASPSAKAPATVAGQVEYELFMVAGNLTEELNKLGAEGWVA